MKRGKKLIYMLLALVVLVGATFLATKLSPEESTDTEEEQTVIFTLDRQSVTALGWDYSEAVHFTASDAGWVYSADAAFPLDESYIDTMLTTLSEITSTKTISDPEDLDQYGLEVPVCTITVTADSEYTLSIGEETTMGGERYFSIGDGNVYLVDEDILSDFSYGLYDVLAYETIPVMSEVTGMTLRSDVQSYEITYEENSGRAYSDSYVWFMGDKTLDTELTDSLISAVTGLSWDSCVEFNATDLSQYGLDSPAAAVTVDYIETVQVETGETDEEGNAVYETEERAAAFALELGSVTDDGCYAKLPGSNMVYLVDMELLDTLLYTTYSELQPDEVILLDWDTVTAMDITLDAEHYTVTRSSKSVTDEEGNTTEEEIWLLGEAEVDAQTVLDALDAVASTGYAAGLYPEHGEQLRLCFHRDTENYQQVELVIYRYDSTQCLVTLNGVATVLADRSAVVELVETVNTLVLDQNTTA